MDLPEHIRMDITTDNLPPNSISYASARMTSRSSGPMKSLDFPAYSKSSKEWEYASRLGGEHPVTNPRFESTWLRAGPVAYTGRFKKT
ncbi:hypothetical protein AVEN_79983-1 [Araneus ventricosus]|uniref:Uncharacterized protein n=1 Tax=Araneus ventricosus TaxID=182803 RepID=A0A4Y2TYC7_ARAVE|nr:hypothetical protein AVEN_79983-1 [Araneus ventricosus]